MVLSVFVVGALAWISSTTCLIQARFFLCTAMVAFRCTESCVACEEAREAAFKCRARWVGVGVMCLL